MANENLTLVPLTGSIWRMAIAAYQRCGIPGDLWYIDVQQELSHAMRRDDGRIYVHMTNREVGVIEELGFENGEQVSTHGYYYRDENGGPIRAYPTVEQGSPEWHRLLGELCAFAVGEGPAPVLPA